MLCILALELHEAVLSFLFYKVSEEDAGVGWHGRQAGKSLGLQRGPKRGSDLPFLCEEGAGDSVASVKSTHSSFLSLGWQVKARDQFRSWT